MAISTYKVFLMHKADMTYEKLVDIKDFPDLGGEPEMLETTTLSDKMQTYIAGIQSMEAMTFKCNYTPTDYDKLKLLEGKEQDLAVWLGGNESGVTVTPTGDMGKFEFKGQVSTYVSGGGVNEVVEMTVSVAPSTPVNKAAAE